ncbi:mitochondrial calcium uniporter regulator 1 [Pungitius pungitius]|uniref:mitochondrial calcium uniporter regulator 1 n=1 Tax=Pungitius pungitius TaxID=134920 RepID=UPI002E0F57AA
MELKQCPSRLKRLGVNPPQRRGDLSLNPKRVCSFVTTTVPPNMSGFSAVNKSPCVRCVVFPPLRNFDKALWRERRAGWRIRNISTVTQMPTRELSTSVKAAQYLKPDVPKSDSGKLFFDTHAVVRIFEENGFTTLQAEVMVEVLARMTNSNMNVIYNDMVTKVQQEIMLQRLMSQIASVKKDMVILEKSEFTALLAENDKLKIQLCQIMVTLIDAMNKVRSDTVMDMNLEKSRAKELKVGHDKMLLERRAEILEMTADQDRHLSQTNMKIETEVAGLKTMLESHKLDTIKYLAGSVFTCLTVVLGFYRIWM